MDVEEEQGVGTNGGDDNALPSKFDGAGSGEKGRAVGRGEGGDVDGGDKGEERENGGRNGKEEFETEEGKGLFTGFFQDVTRFEARGGMESDGFELEDVAFERAGRERKGKEEERKRECKEKEDWEENVFVSEENFKGIGKEFKEERRWSKSKRFGWLTLMLIMVMCFGHCFSWLNSSMVG